jgi:phage shock protein A
MGFFQRIANLWNGFLGMWVSDLERRNPEAVYEAAIQERISRYQELKKAVSNIVYLRNKLSEELEAEEKALREVQIQLPIAVEEGEDEVAIVLIEKKDKLTSRITELSAELDKVSAQADDAKSGLVQFQAEIEKLRREKDEMLAAKANAEARIEIQDTLSGLSTEADLKALDTVRQSISKLKAEADIGAEIAGDGLDAKLAKIKAKAKDASARQQLDDMKRQMAARKAASDGAAVTKTI